MDNSTAIADAINSIGQTGLCLTYLVIAGVLTWFAFNKDSGFLYALATAGLAFAAIAWLIAFPDILGLAFAVLIGSGSGYLGYHAWEFFTRRGGK